METQNVKPVDTKAQVMTRVFNFQGHAVRAVMVNGEQDALFSLTDVCDCCGLNQPSNMASAIRMRFSASSLKFRDKIENMSMLNMDVISKSTLNCGDKGGAQFVSPLESSDLARDLAELEAYSEQLRVKENAAFVAYEDPERDINDVISSYLVETPAGVRANLFITEPQLYFVMFRGRSEMAKAFSMWVCAEVLPAIRSKGYYATPGLELVALPPVPQPDAQGHYSVTYPALIRDVAARYHMSDEGLRLIQWAVERAKAQGYAQAKSKERELEGKLKKATAESAKLKKELAEEQAKSASITHETMQEEWEDMMDETQEELVKLKKWLALYERATRTLLASNTSESEKELIRAAINCLI